MLTEQQIRMIQKVTEEHGKVTPCRNVWPLAFTFMQRRGRLDICLWVNDENESTHLYCEPYKGKAS